MFPPNCCFAVKPFMSSSVTFISSGLPPSLSALTVQKAYFVRQMKPVNKEKFENSNRESRGTLICSLVVGQLVFRNVHREREQDP